MDGASRVELRRSKRSYEVRTRDLTANACRVSNDRTNPYLSSRFHNALEGVGRGHEYHIFAIDRQDNRRTLILTFHIRDWTELSDRGLMILTIDHGAPARNPEIFERRQGPRFDKASIVDRRQPS